MTDAIRRERKKEIFKSEVIKIGNTFLDSG